LLEELQNSDDPLAKVFEFYRRYLDDSVLMFGAQSKIEADGIANRLFVLLKSMNPAFDFTFTGAVKNLVVLDISVELLPEGLRLRNYQKPTDKRTLLSAVSSHPAHVKQSIAYSVALRMRRLCNHEEDFHSALIDQAWALLSRGHEEEWIVKGFSRVVEKSREEALQKSERKSDTKNTVRLVTSYDPSVNVEKVFRRVRKEKSSLGNTTRGTYLKDVHLQLAFRNAPNLRRLLVNKSQRGEVLQPEKFEGFSGCESGCVFCRSMPNQLPALKVLSIFFESLPALDGRRKILQDLKIPTAKCSTTNLVYLCGCLKCGVFYVGETGDAFKTRCSRHRAPPGDRELYLKEGANKNWSELRRHFASDDHQGSFWVAPIAVFAPDGPVSLRKKKEAFWIRKLKPTLNQKLQQKPESRSRSSSVTSVGSPPVSPVIRRKLGIAASTKKN
jgi:hypothetical protein